MNQFNSAGILKGVFRNGMLQWDGEPPPSKTPRTAQHQGTNVPAIVRSNPPAPVSLVSEPPLQVLAGTSTSKELPIGRENCLAGLTFAFTGYFPTLSHEDARILIQQYGGEVKPIPSRTTSYIVVGADVEARNLRIIAEHKLPTIDQEGLFALIRSRPATGNQTAGSLTATAQANSHTGPPRPNNGPENLANTSTAGHSSYVDTARPNFHGDLLRNEVPSSTIARHNAQPTMSSRSNVPSAAANINAGHGSRPPLPSTDRVNTSSTAASTRSDAQPGPSRTTNTTTRAPLANISNSASRANTSTTSQVVPAKRKVGQDQTLTAPASHREPSISEEESAEEGSDSDSEPQPPGYLFHCVLQRVIKPKVSRVLCVPSDMTFAGFHMVLQYAFAWENMHLYSFDISADFRPYREGGYDQIRVVWPQKDTSDGWNDFQPSAKVKLSDIVEDNLYRSEAKGVRFKYNYDLGQRWEHSIAFMGKADGMSQTCEARSPNGRPRVWDITGRQSTPVLLTTPVKCYLLNH